MLNAPNLLHHTSHLIKFILKVSEESILFQKISENESEHHVSKTKETEFIDVLIDRTRQSSEILYIGDLSIDNRLNTPYLSHSNIKSFIGLPVTGLHKQVTGVFYCLFTTPKVITANQIASLNTVLLQASHLISQEERLKYYEEENKSLLTETENQKKILKSSKAGTWIWNLQTGLIIFNERWAEIVGYSLDELKPLSYNTWINLVHKDDINRVQNEVDAYLAKDINIYNIDFKMHHKLGHYVWVNSSGSIVEWTENNEPLLMIGSHTDITALKESEEKNEERKWHLEQIQRISHFGSWIYDAKKKTYAFSKELTEIFGLNIDSDASEMCKYIVETDRPSVEKTKKDCTKLGIPYDITYRIKNANNDILIIEEQGSAIKDSKGRVISAYGALKDITAKKKEEQHLKLLESVITNTKDAVVITEAEAETSFGPKIIYVNDAFTEMTGYSAEEVIGKTPKILQGPKSLNAELKNLNIALKDQKSHDTTTINYKKNGDPFWINFSVTPVHDENGICTHWISIQRDVSDDVNYIHQQNLFSDISYYFAEKETTEQSLQFVLKALLKLLDYSYAEIWIPNEDTNELSLISCEYADDFGKSFEQLNSKDHFKLNGGIEQQLLKTNKFIFWKNVKTHIKFERRENAEKSGLKSAITIPLYAHSEPQGVLLLLNKNELKETSLPATLFEELQHFLGKEIQRKNLEIEFNHVFNFAPDIITTSNSKGFFTKVNFAATKLLEYTEEELLSQSFYNFVHPDDRNLSLEQGAYLMKGLPIYNFENRYITKSGKIVWLNWTATPNFRNGLTYAVAKDITSKKKDEKELIKLNQELKTYTKQLETSNAELEQFAYVASHDLQEPLRMVTSFLTQLKLKYEDALDEKAHTYIHFAVDGAKRMRKIILDILEYARLGTEVEQPEDVDLNTLTEEILSYYRNEITKDKAKIIYNNLPTLHMGRLALFQIFNNIIGNALKYKRQDKPAVIEITAEDKIDFWEFAVKDNGIGIPQPYLEKIFVLFQRLHGKGDYSGSGVGLAIVKKLVYANNGHIWVESKIKKGSTFYIQLPK